MAPVRHEPDDWGWRQPLQGRVAGRTAARPPAETQAERGVAAQLPRLEAYVQHTTHTYTKLRASGERSHATDLERELVRPRGLEPLASCSGGLSGPHAGSPENR